MYLILEYLQFSSYLSCVEMLLCILDLYKIDWLHLIHSKSYLSTITIKEEEDSKQAYNKGQEKAKRARQREWKEWFGLTALNSSL